MNAGVSKREKEEKNLIWGFVFYFFFLYAVCTFSIDWIEAKYRTSPRGALPTTVTMVRPGTVAAGRRPSYGRWRSGVVVREHDSRPTTRRTSLPARRHGSMVVHNKLSTCVQLLTRSKRGLPLFSLSFCHDWIKTAPKIPGVVNNTQRFLLLLPRTNMISPSNVSERERERESSRRNSFNTTEKKSITHRSCRSSVREGVCCSGPFARFKSEP